VGRCGVLIVAFGGIYTWRMSLNGPCITVYKTKGDPLISAWDAAVRQHVTRVGVYVPRGRQRVSVYVSRGRQRVGVYVPQGRQRVSVYVAQGTVAPGVYSESACRPNFLQVENPARCVPACCCAFRV
jgi:hypothetical protein